MTDFPIQRYLTVGRPDDLSGYWGEALGWTVYGFSQLEWASYHAIEKLEHPDKRDESMGQAYTKRCRTARMLISAHVAHDSALVADWAQFWKAAIAAANTRNLIIHNPVSADWRNMIDVGEDDGIRVMTKPGRPLIKLGEVQAFQEHLRTLNDSMTSLFARSHLPS